MVSLRSHDESESNSFSNGHNPLIYKFKEYSLSIIVKSDDFGGHLENCVSHLKNRKNEMANEKYLEEMFQENILKGSCLYPEVQDCQKS